MSDAVTVALFLVEKVLSFLQEELSRDEKVLNDVRRIKGHLSMMQACLQDAEGREGTSQMMKTLVEQIRDVAHKMEDVLDDFMLHAPRLYSERYIVQKSYEFCHHMKHRPHVQQLQSNIVNIQQSMLDIKSLPQFQDLHRIVDRREDFDAQRYMEDTQMVEEDEIMGIDSPKEELINLLNESSRGCKTISVVGPCGAGKTVLVRSAYESKRVVRQFHYCAWLSLRHIHNHEQRLQNLLSQFCMGINELIHSPLGADTAEKLRNYLRDKKYVVVLDNVRKEEEWASIKRILPEQFNGSRIIITTQYGDIATKCAASNNHILQINGLAWKESWRLFCKKAYGNYSGGECPPDLLNLSEMIVKRCEGLPQPISAVGMLLSRKPKLQAEWRRVHDNLVTEMQANCINTMFLPSYYDLTSTQKSCLLYFSLFPEDYSIKRERLIRLWLSEGFIEKSGTVPLEKIAEDCLNELISRNLVHACSRDFRGRVKSCRVLNLMREFICQKSNEKKFAAIVTDSDMNSRDDIITRRLSIENASSGLRRTVGLKLASVRSLFMFGLEKASSGMILETLQTVRLLKVLDLENAPLESFPECILEVALLLRYLSLRSTNVSIVPKNIKKLRYLEYLDLKQTQVTWLPEEIYSLQYLKHLLVHRCNPIKHETFDRLQGVEILGEIKALPLMQKLSIIKVNGSSFFEMLGHLTGLTKLGLVNLREKDGLLLCSCLENMPQLSTLDLRSSSKEEHLDLQHMNAYPKFLQHLYLKGRLRMLPTWIPSLNASLVRLILRWSKLSDSPIEKLQHKLPNLMELEMIDAFTGDILLFDSGAFPKLRTLYIEQFDSLDTILVFNDGMPMLQKLTIVSCRHLWDLPSGIEGLTRLEELHLYDMPQAFTDRLHKDSGDRQRIDHVSTIHSFYVNAHNNTWQIQNFS